jgi:hypothetical protein
MSGSERIESLLAEFRAGYEAGERPDLAAIVERAPEDERQTLRERIDSYLMDAPRRAWDPAAYEASLAKQSVERVWESLEGVSGSWPQLLPHLRNRAKIRRQELVERLAAALGVGDRTERVAEYYNDMEHGRLRAAGVSARVFEALAEIVGTSAETIRAAGEGVRPEAAGGPLFARLAEVDERYLATDQEMAVGGAPEPARSDRDEVDELFTGAG